VQCAHVLAWCADDASYRGGCGPVSLGSGFRLVGSETWSAALPRLLAWRGLGRPLRLAGLFGGDLVVQPEDL
jgi:hypothetical protein